VVVVNILYILHILHILLYTSGTIGFGEWLYYMYTTNWEMRD